MKYLGQSTSLKRAHLSHDEGIEAWSGSVKECLRIHVSGDGDGDGEILSYLLVLLAWKLSFAPLS